MLTLPLPAFPLTGNRQAAGEHLNILPMPEHAATLNRGGPNRDEIYCCCSTSVCRVKMKVAGYKLGYMG